MTSNRYRWWHGLAFYAGVQVARVLLRIVAEKTAHQGDSGSRAEDREFYKSEKLPIFAPPAAAFPIAWSINSVAAIAGGLHVLNLPARTDGRADFLRLQGAAWALFAGFDAAYFGLRSPINAAAVTLLYSAVTLASIDVAWNRLHGSKAAVSLAPTAAWLALANPVGLTQAAWNRDPYWNAGPWIEPDPKWVKDAATIRPVLPPPPDGTRTLAV